MPFHVHVVGLYAKPYEFIGAGDIHGPKPYEFIGFGDIRSPKPYEFIGFGDMCMSLGVS
jgi:hypothetical protein